ncbi:MAG: hydrogenase 4 subunit B [Pseudomonadota bacterium]
MTAAFELLSVNVALVVIVIWLSLGILGFIFRDHPRFVHHFVFPIGAVAGLILALAAITNLDQAPTLATLPLGLPDFPFNLRVDALSAFFLILLGTCVFGVSLFSAGYFRDWTSQRLGLLVLQYHFFIVGMALVLIADDALVFMIAWEVMALSSYFLVTLDHHEPQNQAAGFIYLLIAHLGALCLLFCFGAMQDWYGDYTFEVMRDAHLSGPSSTVAFLLALLGFGAKAGLLPLHIWLPEAHPAAPSPVSALMSAVMLKTAIYGLLRVTFDLLDTQLWWWGALVLGVGLLTALFGVMFAAVQTDIKRLLAYSSIENMGLLAVAFGLTILFNVFNMPLLAALSLTAMLYHALNHTIFKALLFLATGAVTHATGSRCFSGLGGLIHRMPWVAGFSLIGILAASGLPPLNGFVSEWLLLQSFLLTPGLPHSYLNMLVPVAAAAIALAASLAAYVMVKFYGLIFLGQPRSTGAAGSDPGNVFQQIGMAWLAMLCVILGLIPHWVIQSIDYVTQSLIGAQLAPASAKNGWLLITPLSSARASYSPIIFMLMIVLVTFAVYLLVRKYFRRTSRRADPWDCGYPLQTSRMQDTAEGFGQPISQIFEPAFEIERVLPSPADIKPVYRKRQTDRFWAWFYQPIGNAVEWFSIKIGKLQHGRIQWYLLYSFATLLVLLIFVR